MKHRHPAYQLDWLLPLDQLLVEVPLDFDGDGELALEEPKLPIELMPDTLEEL